MQRGNQYKKVMLVLGSRPEALKNCPLVNGLKTRSGIKTMVCVTARHHQILDQILENFGVIPDYDLNIRIDKLYSMSQRISSMELKRCWRRKKPMWFSSRTFFNCFCDHLGMFFLEIPGGYLEAGLSIYNIVNTKNKLTQRK